MDQLLRPVGDGATYSSQRSTLLREKLHDTFGPTEWIRVINPDTDAVEWDYLPPEREQISFDPSSTTVPMKIVHRDPPEHYRLEAGQSAVLVGANAYLMMDVLIKQMMAKGVRKAMPRVEPGKARNFNFSDDTVQHELIARIYLGKAQPFVPAEPTPIEEISNQIDSDLGLTDEPKFPAKGSKRPSRATA